MNTIDREISAAHLKASGWQLDLHASGDPFNCHFFYIADFRTEHIQLVSVPQAEFERVPIPTDVLPGKLAELISRLMLVHDNPHHEWQQELTVALSAFFKSTRTYSHWLFSAPAGERLHAVIHIYGDKSASRVRPAALSTASTILPVDEFTALSKQILETDRASHPEWFRQ